MAKQIKAPTTAPTQTVKETGKGPTVKGQAGHPTQPPLAPKPRMAATTGPKIGTPSVNYRQPRPGGTISTSMQQQQLQDKGTP